MSNKKIYQLQANACKALAHATRIEIIETLLSKEMSFSQLLKKIGGAKSNLSQHLSSMTSKGLLLQRKEGLNMYYKLSSKKVSAACLIMRKVMIENLKKQNAIINKR